MLHRPLGNTGLSVSILGLGTGTRFGDRRNHSQPEATRLVRGALDLGINYIDTAAMYLDAETMLGEALAGVPRDQFILATKFFPADEHGSPITPAQLRASVERSLQHLRLETVDVLQVHGLRPHWHTPVMAALGDELERLKREGKYRFLGVAETIVDDPYHAMLPLAAPTGRFSTALVAYSLLSPWAEQNAVPTCAKHGVGVVGMVAVRRALRDPAMLRDLLHAARNRGEPGAVELPDDNALEWLLDADCPTLAAAGYRFAIAHPGVASVLSGTLNLEHLEANLAAVCAPPMPEQHLAKIRQIFLRMNPERWRPFDL
jgi:L-galactose dehydrogenase